MSATLSLRIPDTIYILTDAAGYDDNGVIRALSRKVMASRKVPYVVNTRGNAVLGNLWARRLTELADRLGVEGAALTLVDILNNIRNDGSLTTNASASNFVEVFVAGWSPFGGAFHFRFDTSDWAIIPLGTLAYAGPLEVDPHQFVQMPLPRETSEAWMRRAGVEAMRTCRSQRGRGPDGEPMDHFVIGGWLDLTTVDATGVRTETVLQWPEDVVGEKIAPRRAA